MNEKSTTTENAAADEAANYNDELWLNENVLPLVKQLHVLCAERGIPFLAAFAHGLDAKLNEESKETRYMMGGSCHLPGNDRTPPEMHLAQKLIFEGIDAAAPHFAAEALKGIMGLRKSSTEY